VHLIWFDVPPIPGCSSRQAMAPKAKAKAKAKGLPKVKAKAGTKAKAKAAPKGKGSTKTVLEPEPVLPTDPLAFRFYGDTQAFIAVKTSLVPKILEEGYKVEVRDHVPCSVVPANSVKAMSANWKDVEDCVALEIHNVPKSQIDVASGRVLTKHLDPKYLRDGVFMTRGASDYTNAPCPICGKKMSDKADQRGQIGLRRYVQQAFMVTPCDDPACVALQVDRQKRLNSGKTLWLYHITDRKSADLIKQAGGKMLRGAGGNAGGGIYFGLSAEDCERKALHSGVILKCRVQVGKPFSKDACTNHSFAKLLKAKQDCVHGKIGYSTKSYIIYSWDQVQVAAEVDINDKVKA